MLESLLVLVLSAIAALTLLLLSVQLTTTLTTDEDRCLLLTGSFIVAVWLMTASFCLLAPFGLFRWPIVLALLIVLLCILARLTKGSLGKLVTATAFSLGAAVDEALSRWHEIAVTSKVLLAGAAVLLCGATIHGLVSPPLAWDSLTYHLPRAAMLVQHGGSMAGLGPFPGAWGYYFQLPPGGAIVWAWLLLTRTDLLLAPFGLLVVFVCGLASYGLARRLGAAPQAAILTGAIVTLLPAVFVFATAAYVNNLVLALFLCGSLQLSRLAVPPSKTPTTPSTPSTTTTPSTPSTRGHFLIAAAAFSLAAGMQHGAVPAFAVAAIAALVMTVKHRSAGALVTIALALLVMLPGLHGYGQAWLDHGSPCYPIPLTIGDRLVFPGHPQLERLLASPTKADSLSLAEQAAWLFWRSYPGCPSHCNFSVAALLLFPLSLGGLASLLGRKRIRSDIPPPADSLTTRAGNDPAPGPSALLTVLFIAVTLLAIAAYCSPNGAVIRTNRWLPTTGRHFLPGLVALLLPSAVITGAFATALRHLALAILLVMAVIHCQATIFVPALAALVATPAIAALTIALVASLWCYFSSPNASPTTSPDTSPTTSPTTSPDTSPRSNRNPRPGLLLPFTVAATVFACTVLPCRDSWRLDYYERAASIAVPAYEGHPLYWRYAAAQTIWRKLATAPAAKIAVTTAHDLDGHNWLLAPLMGQRYQHELFYVPISADGSLPRHDDEPARRRLARFACWQERLKRLGIDYVAVLPPAPIEGQWLAERPHSFQLLPPLACGGDGALYRRIE